MFGEVKSFLKELIRIKSLSGKEKELADLLEKKLKDLDYEEVYRDDLGNVIGRIGEGEPKVMFEGHMDTVGPGNVENWDYEPFSATEENGKIYGRGASDMKGALASMIYAGSESKETIKNSGGSFYVANVVHEETAEGLAIKNVLENYVKPDYVVLGEPTDLDVCIGHRGRGVVDMRTYGRTSHASMPHLGKNAAYDLLDVVNVIREQELKEDDLLGKETKALVHISCEPGEGPVVPDKARAVFDYRIVEGTKKEDLIKKFEEVFEELNVEGEASIVKETLKCYTGKNIETPYYFPAWKTEDEEFIKKVKKGINSSGINTRSWEFSTDGVYTAGVEGIPTIGYGPGIDELAHQPNEYLEISHLKNAVRSYEGIIKELIS